MQVRISEANTMCLKWTTPDEPVISGTAKDLSPITKVWLTIKDETANRFWNGAEWHATTATVGATEITGSTTVAWRYTGLRREVMRSGIFTITAYAQDKFGHTGHAMVPGRNKKKYDLGSITVTNYTLNVKEVKNKYRTEGPDSFIMKAGEDVVSVSAEIIPERLAPTLDPMVNWQVSGVNAVSGTPTPPQKGGHSEFYVRNPVIPAIPAGRGVPMSYTVIPRIDYPDVYADDMLITYYSQDQRNITQDANDQCRQEYVDFLVGTHKFGGLYVPERGLNDNDFSTSGQSAGGYFTFNKLNSGDYPFGIVKQRLYVGLEKLRASIRASRPGLKDQELEITGGYRNPIHNKGEGGRPDSRHQWGDAVDIELFDINGDGIIGDAGDFILFDQIATNNVGEDSPSAGYTEPIKEAVNHYHVDWRIK
jgi:hypothetical protein